MGNPDCSDDRDKFLPNFHELPTIAARCSNGELGKAWSAIVKLSHKLRADKKLMELLAQTGVADAEVPQVIVQLSRFPWTALYRPARSSRAQAAALRRAVVELKGAVKRFETITGEWLPSLNTALPELVSHGGDAGRERIRKVLTEDAGEAWIYDYLSYIEFLLDEGELSSSCPDPLIRLPAGGWSAKPHTRATWLAIRAIRSASGDPSANPAFRAAVVHAVELMTAHVIDVNDVAAMLANEAGAASKKIREFAGT